MLTRGPVRRGPSRSREPPGIRPAHAPNSAHTKMTLQFALHAPQSAAPRLPVVHPEPTRRTGTVLCFAVAADCAATLRDAVERTADALSAFEQVRWLVVECGSSDDTVAQLEALRRERPGFEFETLGRRALASTSSTQRLALGRTRCLERLASDPRLRDVEHLVDVDLGSIRLGAGAAR